MSAQWGWYAKCSIGQWLMDIGSLYNPSSLADADKPGGTLVCRSVRLDDPFRRPPGGVRSLVASPRRPPFGRGSSQEIRHG